MPKNKFKGSNYLIDSNFHRQGWQGAAKAATGLAPLKKYISQKAGSFKDQNRGVSQTPKKKRSPKRPLQKKQIKKQATFAKLEPLKSQHPSTDPEPY